MSKKKTLSKDESKFLRGIYHDFAIEYAKHFNLPRVRNSKGEPRPYSESIPEGVPSLLRIMYETLENKKKVYESLNKKNASTSKC